MKHLIQYIEKEQSELFKRKGAFYAFSEQQLEEGRPKDRTVKLVNMGGGLICPRDNVKALLDGLNKILQIGVEKDLKDNGAEAIIRREYFNHECQISMDTENARNALNTHVKAFPEVFTEQLINATFQKAFQHAVEKDLF